LETPLLSPVMVYVWPGPLLAELHPQLHGFGERRMPKLCSTANQGHAERDRRELVEAQTRLTSAHVILQHWLLTAAQPAYLFTGRDYRVQ